MNRRNAIKAAVAGLAAVVGWKRAAAETCAFQIGSVVDGEFVPWTDPWEYPNQSVVFEEFTIYDEAEFDAVEFGPPSGFRWDVRHIGNKKTSYGYVVNYEVSLVPDQV